MKKPLMRVLSFLLALAVLSTTAFGAYPDGTWTGTAEGRGGALTVEVTVADGKITQIDVGENSETASYLATAKAIIDDITSSQSLDVDTVSGATLSSRAIKNATIAAINSASEKPGIFDSGNGSIASPYAIATVAQLQAFALDVNGGETYLDKYVKLVSDIDISGIDWTPIDLFAGTFDGDGHVVDGLTIGSESGKAALANAGFFASLAKTAVIKNLGLENVAIYATNSGALSRAGGLAATSAAGTAADGGAVIYNCHVTGSVVSMETTSAHIAHAGGLIGACGTYMTIANCYTDIDVVSRTGGTNAAYGGGIAAMGGNNGTILNSYALGDVTLYTSGSSAATGALAGGLVGMMVGKAYNCYASGNITVTGVTSSNGSVQFTAVGALAGQLIKTTGGLNHSYYSADTVITINGTAVTPVPCGTATESASKQPENISAPSGLDALVSVLNMGVSTLNNGTADIEVNPANAREFISVPAGVTLLNWDIADGKIAFTESVTPSIPDDSIFDSGSGSELDPYVIATEEQLRAFATSLSDTIDYANTFIRLANDIALAGGEWIPVGEGDYLFSGHFDGNGHAISGLTYASDGVEKDASKTLYVGFIGILGGTVKNLSLLDVSITAIGTKTVYAGAVTGYAYTASAVIDNVFASGTVYCETTEEGNNFSGGLAGSLYRGIITNSGADVFASSVQRGGYWAEVGGITSMNNRGYILNCYSLGDVYAYASRALEAAIAASNLVGMQAGILANSYATGDLETSDWAQTIGAASGDTTAIGTGYFLYYNSEASQNIGGQTPSPIVGVGLTAKMPDEDDPSILLSGFNHELTPLEAASFKSQDLADLLNLNLTQFPVDLTALPASVELNSWELANGTLAPSGAPAAVTFVPVIFIDDTPPAFQAGEYLGRDEGKSQTVGISVTDDSIISITLLDPATLDGSGEIIEQAILNPNALASLPAGSDALISLKEAISAALDKAKIGDKTGYGSADPSIFESGQGSLEDPYIIKSESQLRAFASAINIDESFSGKFISLAADIELSEEWIPTGGGNGAHSFSGTFDGGNHEISNVAIGMVQPSRYLFAGFFGYGNAMSVKNLSLKNVFIDNIYSGDDRAFAGGLVAGLDGMSYIDGVTVSGEIRNNAAGTGSCSVGGIVGFASGYGNVATGSPENSYSTFISNSGSDVAVSGQSFDGWVYAGGIIGNTNRTYITNAYSLGDVTVWSGSDDRANFNRAAAGGIAGFNAGYVANAYALGNMKSVTVTTDVGGYAGRHTGIATSQFVYYNMDALHSSGDSALSPAPGVGYVVSSSTGSAPDLTGKIESELKSPAFADLLNENLASVANPNPDQELKLWAYDEESGFVKFKPQEPIWLKDLKNPFLGEWQSEIPSAGTLIFTYKTDGSFDYEMVGVPPEEGGIGKGAYTVIGNRLVTYLDFEGAAMYEFEVIDNNTILVTELEAETSTPGSTAPFIRVPGSDSVTDDLPFVLENELNGSWRALIPPESEDEDPSDVVMIADSSSSCSFLYLDYDAVYSGSYFTIDDVIGFFSPDLNLLELFQFSKIDEYAFSFTEFLGLNEDGSRNLGATADFKRLGDKAALAAKVDELKDTEESSFTSESWEAFQAALLSAQEALDDEYATQETLDTAIADLEAAFDELAEESGTEDEDDEDEDEDEDEDDTDTDENDTDDDEDDTDDDENDTGEDDNDTDDDENDTDDNDNGENNSGNSGSDSGYSGGGYYTTTSTPTPSPTATPTPQPTPGATAAVPIENFTDVKKTDWFYNDIDFVLKNNLFYGTSESAFSPYAPMTRGMIVTVLHRLAGLPKPGTGSFPDVVAGSWYSDAVAWGFSNGIVAGIAGGQFAPDMSVNREQLVVFFYRYALLIGKAKPSADLSAFRDASGISSWARPAFEWAVGAGIVYGKGNGILDPISGATRAEVAAIARRFALFAQAQ
jgi:uncharacterized protein with FMN-binding domain